MLIHFGGDEFIHLEDCVGIFNFSTLEKETQNLIRKVSGDKLPEHFRSALLQRNSKWLFSVISSESLVTRSLIEGIEGAWYTRPRKNRKKEQKPEKV